MFRSSLVDMVLEHPNAHVILNDNRVKLESKLNRKLCLCLLIMAFCEFSQVYQPDGIILKLRFRWVANQIFSVPAKNHPTKHHLSLCRTSANSLKRATQLKFIVGFRVKCGSESKTCELNAAWACGIRHLVRYSWTTSPQLSLGLSATMEQMLIYVLH